MKKLNVPIALFLFKRVDSLERIFFEIRKVNPKKIYLLADGPRNEDEKILTETARKKARSLIDWECEVIEYFQEENVGVHRNIGQGANFVFETEKEAIFLEDDSLPENTFFQYCEELLDRYRYQEEILWICGTNYIQENKIKTNSSYFFTRNLLPCGWASWSSKFKKFYDGDLEKLNINGILKMESTYLSKKLFKQELNSIYQTKYLLENDIKKASWDRQMCYSLRSNELYGVAPKTNLIRNIGVDDHSIHGGNSLRKTMTRRFCELNANPLIFPLNHPEKIKVDSAFEEQIENVILYPLTLRLKILLGQIIKKILLIDKNRSLTQIFNDRRSWMSK